MRRYLILGAMALAALAIPLTATATGGGRGTPPPSSPEQITEFCVSELTNQMFDRDTNCQAREFSVNVAQEAPFTVCYDPITHVLRYYPDANSCPAHLEPVQVEGDGSVNVGVNKYTREMLGRHFDTASVINKVL